MRAGRLENPVATQRPEGKLENALVTWSPVVGEGKLENPVVSWRPTVEQGKLENLVVTRICMDFH